MAPFRAFATRNIVIELERLGVKDYFLAMAYAFSASSQREILSVALIFSEDKTRLFSGYRKLYSAGAIEFDQVFTKFIADEMQAKEQLLNAYKERFGNELAPQTLTPLQALFFRLWFNIKKQSDAFEKELERFIWLERKSLEFYNLALKHVLDLDLRSIFNNLAEQAQQRKTTLKKLLENYRLKPVHSCVKEQKYKEKLLTLIQPGLAGLMDGSISTLAPIFAAAFATNNTKETFLVGLSASIGAGISMGFTEAIHDDGKISGRGSPLKRGLANGVMTTIGGLGHTLPYLINNFELATTIAIILVFIELWIIVWIQNKFMKISFRRAITQVVLGGVLVFAVGIIIGKS